MQDLEFALQGKHRFLLIRQDGYDIVVSTPRIADVSPGPDLITIIVSLGLIYLMIGYAAVNWLFKPIRAIRTGAAHIGRGNFAHRIRDIRSDQLGDLASDINVLAADVQRMLDAKRALLLGISHELRTPLSRMRLLLEFLDKDEDRDALSPEIAEMETIVASLIEAEQLSDRHVALNRSSVRLKELIDKLIGDFFERDRDRISLAGGMEGVRANLDEARIALMLKNLISNALRYVPESGGRVEISAATDGDELVLRVHDNGPGMSSEQAAHIGEPFYRGDPSRARDTGGTGLGLYLATLVAEAHRGSLRLVNPGQAGACFECRVPRGFDIKP